MTVLHAGMAQGPVLLLDEPLSFWGAFDPRSGTIIDIHHPQRGQNLKGKILLMLESRGSGSASGGLAEAIRLGPAPAGIILVQPDINLAIGAAVAETLYGKTCPVLAVATHEIQELPNQPICISPMTAGSGHPSTMPEGSARGPMKLASITQRLSGLGSDKWAVHIEGKRRATPEKI